MSPERVQLLIRTLLFILLCVTPCIKGIRWLALAKMSSVISIQSEENCDQLVGLIKRQKRICKRNVEVMDSVKLGAHMAIEECQHQFRNRRWNCSTVNAISVFGNALNHGTRETAFVHAISSAGVAHAVTRACSSGELQTCGCDRTVQGRSAEGFEWSGCSDNIAYGSAFSKIFVDARERGRKTSLRQLMNLHNNGAGRRSVEELMKVECKCHGVSGSCEMKTCWKAMPSFREIGRRLKEKFDGATEVTLSPKRIGSAKRLVPRNANFKPHTPEDLVYLVPSPDYCDTNPKIGSLGTTGRICNGTSKAIDGCDLMCCGRGHKTRKIEIVERCLCKFHWCCYVKCKECKRIVDEHTCL